MSHNQYAQRNRPRRNWRPPQQQQSSSAPGLAGQAGPAHQNQGPPRPPHPSQTQGNHTSTSKTESAPKRKPNKPKPKKAGPPLPPFKWFTSFPQAQLFYLYQPEQALVFLPKFKENLLSLTNEPAIGFDMEWKPNFVAGHTENPVALIQLASTDAVVLLHIARWNWSDSKTYTALEMLKDLLHDSKIKKLGVNISEDGRKLYRDTRVDLLGCIDLSKLVRVVDPETWPGKEAIGLARLCGAYLGLDLDKRKKVSRSNWELPLDEEQMIYAANDAAVAVAIYERIKLLVNAASPPSVSDYEFNVIEGAFRELTLAALETARSLMPPPPVRHREEYIAQCYGIQVIE